MSNSLRIGFIGCGRIVLDHHLPILAAIPNVALIAAADSSPDRLAQARRIAPSLQTFERYEDMLQQAHLDAVLVCVPTVLHAKAAIAALEAGLNVYLEKPFATNLVEGEQILAAWRRSGRIGMIGFNYRFNSLQVHARRLLKEGALGTVGIGRSIFSDSTVNLPAWLKQRQTGGGPLLELGSHHFDLWPCLFDSPVAQVKATLGVFNSQDEYAAVDLRLQNGLLIQCSFIFGALHSDRFQIYGERGELLIDRFRSVRLERPIQAGWLQRLTRIRRLVEGFGRSTYLGDQVLASTKEDSYEAALSYFVNCVSTGQMPKPDFMDGFRSLTVVVAAEQSAASGRTIRLDLGLGA